MSFSSRHVIGHCASAGVASAGELQDFTRSRAPPLVPAAARPCGPTSVRHVRANRPPNGLPLHLHRPLLRGYAGGAALPYVFDPQQTTLPFVRTPQLWGQPTLTESNAPGGGAACPCRFAPPAGERTVRSHAAGGTPTGAHRGKRAWWRSGLAILISTPASHRAVRPHAASVEERPALTDRKVPAGGTA